jgi:tRNA G18 (ribose-2'-O)-methylase SpoU
VKGGVETIYGLHAVRSMLLRKPERVRAVKFAERRDDPRTREIEELARKGGRPIQRIDARALAQSLGDVAHQGVIAEIEPHVVPWRSSCRRIARHSSMPPRAKSQWGQRKRRRSWP